MLLDKLNAGYGADTEFGSARGKTIGEFSNREWEKLLDKVDNALEDYKEDLKQREEESLKDKEEKKAKNRQIFQDETWHNKHFHELNAGTNREEKNDEIPKIKGSMEDYVDQQAIQKIIGYRGKIPYSALADENGIINYKGAMFVGDPKTNSLSLGDMSDPNNVMTIPLSDGGFLKVNYENIDSLCGVIDMFSPEDINAIMRAIAKHNRIEQIKQQIEDEASGLPVMEKNEDVAFYA